MKIILKKVNTANNIKLTQNLFMQTYSKITSRIGDKILIFILILNILKEISNRNSCDFFIMDNRQIF